MIQNLKKSGLFVLARAGVFAGALVLGLGFNSSAQAEGADPYYQLRAPKLRVTQVKDFEAAEFQGIPSGTEPAPGAGKVSFDDIIRIGEKVFEIIKKGQAVVNVKGARASALPKGLDDWRLLERWKAPRSVTYTASYENLLGMEVISFTFDLVYSYGGSYEGKGAYLANVTVKPKDLSVAWGFNFDASVEIPEVLNIGTKADPIAGMQLDVLWTVSSPISNNRASETFFVQGDGELIDPIQ